MMHKLKIIKRFFIGKI